MPYPGSTAKPARSLGPPIHNPAIAPGGTAALAAKAGIAPLMRQLQPRGETKLGEQSATARGLRKPVNEVRPATEGLSWEGSAEGARGGKVRSQVSRV